MRLLLSTQTRATLLAPLLVSVFWLWPNSTRATELTQLFPAVPDGQTVPEVESGWRISWRMLEPNEQQHTIGNSHILEFTSIEFMRGTIDGREDWITVLSNLTMVEMYVLYNDGTNFLDIGEVGVRALEARPEYLPQSGVVSAKIEDRFVVSEVVDDGVRWLDNRDDHRVRRGQTLKLWAAFQAGNYTYITVYSFADDGTIGVRVGGTAQNLMNWDGSAQGLDDASHVHMGAWRMEFDLGSPSANRVEMVERVMDSTNRPRVEYRAFNGGLEGCELWDADRYTMLSVASTTTMNRHDPPRHVSYVLKTVELGRLRDSSQPVTECDFWASRLVPSGAVRNLVAPETYLDLPGVLADPEPLSGEPVVIWHNSGLLHIPRGEDFGPVGYWQRDGAAVVSYAGFDLVPVNIWHKTPFLER